MDGNAIRAGRAFVEMFIDDDDVKQSLDQVKQQFQGLGTTIDAVGAKSFTAMSAQANVSAVATVTSVGTMTAALVALRGTLLSIVNVIRAIFTAMTASTARVTVALLGVGRIIKTFLPASPLGKLFDNFLNNSQRTELTGRWTRLIGGLTGSRLLTDAGNRIERLGLGSAVVAGFRRGFLPGLQSTLGAGVRSARSYLASQAAGLALMPFRAARAVTGSVVGVVAPKTGATIVGQAAMSQGAFQAAGSANVLKVASTGLGSALGRLAGYALRVGVVTAAITGPALSAAKQFVASAQEITREAEESGKSIESLIAKKYGKNSFITPADIAAAAALGDVMTELKQAVAAAWAQIGIAALPTLRRMTEFLRDGAQAVTLFLANNRPLITTAISLAARIGSVAGAVIGLYGAWVALTPVIAALASPLGLVAAALAGLIYFFPEIRTAAADAFDFLFPNFGSLLTVVQETLQGVMDALVAGDLSAAGRVLWSGLELAWLEGTERLREIYRNMVTNLSGTVIDLFSGLRTGWVVITSFLSSAWSTVVGGMVSVWSTAQNAIAGGMARVIAKMTGQDVNEVLATLQEMQEQESQAANQSRQQAVLAQAEQTRNRLAAIEEERQAMHETNQEMRQEQEEAARRRLDAARQEFAAARNAAAEARKKTVAPAVNGAAAAATSPGFSSISGSFSAAGIGRTGVSGLSDLKGPIDKTAINTGALVDLAKQNKGLAFQ